MATCGVATHAARQAPLLFPGASETLTKLRFPFPRYFVDAVFQGYREARRHVETMVTLMEIMAFRSKFPCFVKDPVTPIKK